MRLPLWASHTSFCATCHGESRKSDDASVAATATHQMQAKLLLHPGPTRLTRTAARSCPGQPRRTAVQNGWSGARPRPRQARHRHRNGTRVQHQAVIGGGSEALDQRDGAAVAFFGFEPGSRCRVSTRCTTCSTGGACRSDQRPRPREKPETASPSIRPAKPADGRVRSARSCPARGR